MRLVDAEKIVKDLAEKMPKAARMEYVRGLAAAIETVIGAPVIEPHRRGYWVHRIETAGEILESCSLCGCDADLTRFEGKSFMYCPHCGAKMRDDDD